MDILKKFEEKYLWILLILVIILVIIFLFKERKEMEGFVLVDEYGKMMRLEHKNNSWILSNTGGDDTVLIRVENTFSGSDIKVTLIDEINAKFKKEDEIVMMKYDKI